MFSHVGLWWTVSFGIGVFVCCIRRYRVFLAIVSQERYIMAASALHNMAVQAFYHALQSPLPAPAPGDIPRPIKNKNRRKCPQCGHKPGYWHECGTCYRNFCPACVRNHVCAGHSLIIMDVEITDVAEALPNGIEVHAEEKQLAEESGHAVPLDRHVSLNGGTEESHKIQVGGGRNCGIEAIQAGISSSDDHHYIPRLHSERHRPY